MAELNTLARPYARAAFEYAEAGEQLEAWSKGLGLLAALVGEPRVAALLDHPGLTAERKATAISDLLDGEIDRELGNFVRILADNNRLALLPTIAAQFQTLKAEREQSVDVEISSAYELADDEIQMLKEALGQRLQREVRLQTSTDTNLLGGVYIRANDTVIDASLRGRLAKLAEATNS